LFAKSGICVAVKEKLTKDSGVAGAFDYNHIVAKLLAKPKARGEIYSVFAKLFAKSNAKGGLWHYSLENYQHFMAVRYIQLIQITINPVLPIFLN
jgi:hypothetical protein